MATELQACVVCGGALEAFVKDGFEPVSCTAAYSGGVVALSTGDRESLAARVSGKRWHLLTPRHHNFFFTASTLTRLLERSGFHVVWLGHPGARYSLAHLAHKGLPAAVSERVARSRLRRVSLPVNLFDIVTVVARKTQ